MKNVKRLSVLLCIFSAVFFACEEKNVNLTTKIEMKIPELHNGDAKFYRDNIITNVSGKLFLYDLQGNIQKYHDDVMVNWLDSISDDGIIVYGNWNKEIGVVRLDENFELISNQVIVTSENLMIDPSITKVNEDYYLTFTEIVGNVNNSDTNQENGTYTIRFYHSKDLENWEYVSDVLTAQNNLEDVDILFANDKFYVCYEKETVDKGISSIYVRTSIDSTGSSWEDEKILWEAGCDCEPAVYIKGTDGWNIYYSSDKEFVGESYMGGKIYTAKTDDMLNILEWDIPVDTESEKGILLYDVAQFEGKEYFLYAQDYLTTCDLVIETRIIK